MGTREPNFRSYWVQKDPRTSYTVKKMLMYSPLVLSLLGGATVAGIHVLKDKFTPCNPFTILEDPPPCETTGVRVFSDFSYFVAAISILLFVFSLVVIVFRKNIWFRQTFQKKQEIGEDVEDTDPYILARSGQELSKKSDEDFTKLMRMSDKY
jgi:Ca2+/H+ antiporter